MKIGNKEIIFAQTFLVPDGEEASFVTKVADNDDLPCRIVFLHEEGEDSKPRIKIDYDEKVFFLKFFNFDSSMGHATTKPILFAESDKGLDVSFLAIITKLKSLTKIEIQIMLGEKA